MSRTVWYGVLVRVGLCLATMFLGAAFVPLASSSRQTTNPSIYVTIHVTLTRSTVVVTPKDPPRGSMGRFVMRNLGSKPVTFSVGSDTPGLGLKFGFTSVVKPGTETIRIVYLSIRGKIPYHIGTSFAGAKAKAKGLLEVGAGCSACAPPGPPLPP